MLRFPVFASTALAMVLAGCAVKRDTYETPQVPLPDTFREAAKTASPSVAAEVPVAPAEEDTLPRDLSRWWTRFGSEELNRLVDQALENNWQVKAAVARLAQAEAGWRRTRASELPNLDGFATAGAEAPREGVGNRRPGQEMTSQRTYEVGVRASYEVDLWGANRAASVAAWEQAQASAFARRTVAWTLTADVVTAYLQYLSMQDRVNTATDTLRVMRGLLDAVRQRMEGGDADALQVAQQRTAVAEASAVIPVLKLQRDQAQHALALLIGTTPDKLNLEGTGISGITFPVVQPGIPSRLLLRRPDILQAEHELLAADANIDEARAAFLPSFNLTAETGYGSHYLSNLLRPESLMWSLAASALVAIFDAGENDARLDVARARHRELVSNYMQASYAAMRDVEDALSSVHYLSQRLDSQREAVAAAREAHELSLIAYSIGTVDYLTLLNTERTLFENEDIFHRIEFERANASVALFRALGGDAEAQATAGDAPTADAPQAPTPFVATSATPQEQGSGQRLAPTPAAAASPTPAPAPAPTPAQPSCSKRMTGTGLWACQDVVDQ